MSAIAAPAQPCNHLNRIHNPNCSDTTCYHIEQNLLFTVQSSENTRCCKAHSVSSSHRCKWHLCWETLDGSHHSNVFLLVCAKPRTTTKRWLMTTPASPGANGISSVWCHIHQLGKVAFSAKVSYTAKHHWSWMHDVLVMVFISSLKAWDICSWLRFCFPKTGYLVYEPVESFISSQVCNHYAGPHVHPSIYLTRPAALKAPAPSVDLTNQLWVFKGWWWEARDLLQLNKLSVDLPTTGRCGYEIRCDCRE